MQFKAGRFEVAYGNQRVFGAVDWHNIGRSWDGLMLSYIDNNVIIDIFDLKRIEHNFSIDPQYNRDEFFIIGGHSSLTTIGIEMFFFYEDYACWWQGYDQYTERYNIGGYYKTHIRDFYFLVQGNYQLGEEKYVQDTHVLKKETSAFMTTAEIEYSFKMENPLRLTAGIDYTSGYDASDPNKYNAYRNDYYTGHAFRGYMDYFIGSPNHGLVNWMFRSSFNYQKAWIFKGDFHYFQAAEDYWNNSRFPTTKANDIGMEIDLTVVNKSVEGATIAGGVSAFLPDAHFSYYGDDSDPGLWAYFMTTVDF